LVLLTTAWHYPDDGTVFEINDEARGGWLPWHSDRIYTDTIDRGAILRPVQLPSKLGMTDLIDQIAANDRLPNALKARIDKLQVVYGKDLNIENHKFVRPECVRFVRGAKCFDSMNTRVLHPMVYVQAETGREVLNVSPGFALGIYEMGGEGVEHFTGPALATSTTGAMATCC
jgi:taurine dioxygenase